MYHTNGIFVLEVLDDFLAQFCYSNTLNLMEVVLSQKNLSGLLNLIGENARIGVLPFHSLGKIEKSHHFLVH